MGDDSDEQIDEETINKKKKDIKKSRLKMSLNNNIFNFTNKNDENYTQDLTNEINDLYKQRDKMEDKLNDAKEEIDNQKKKLTESIMQNMELKRIIEEKNKEIEKLKNK